MSPSSAREILAIHPGALGDVLQAVPALSLLRALDGGSRVTFSGQPRLGRFLLEAGVVDAALPFDGLGLEHLFTRDPVPESVKAGLGRFGRVVSWFGARSDPYPARLREIVADALLAPPVPETGESAVWEHLLASVARWGISRHARPTPLDLPRPWRDEASDALARLGLPPGRAFLAVHPGAGGAAKRWPVGRFALATRTVVGHAAHPVVLHRGPADAESARDLLAALSDPPAIDARCLIEPSLGLLAGVLSGASAFLGGDSGVSHLAAAAGARAVIVFPAATRRRWSPWSPTAVPVTMTLDERDVGIVAQTLGALLRGEHPDELDSPVGGA